MKLIYSELKKLLPELDIKPQKLRDDLTMIGHFCNYYQEIDSEIVFDLDIKVNRGDCLGYHGICRDLSILYQIPLALPQSIAYPQSNYSLPIKVETDNVTRVMAIKIIHLKNTPSPTWLQTVLKLHQINSINLLVDLTNYIMLVYGIPSHAFDTSKSTDNLIWQMNPGYNQFTSLDGTVLPIDKSVLMINNPHRALSLSFWGGTACAIDQSTTDTIVELAIYNPTTIRQNTRQLKTTTEASVRLEKALDPNLIPQAFNHLVSLIIKYCGGTIGSAIFDFYPNPLTPPLIEFDPKNPSIYSGIDIPESFALDIVAKVGSRPDITLEEDLIEEVVRFWGYQHIPTSSPLSAQTLPDITPPIIYLIEQIKDKLVALGYDEVLSWPLVSAPLDKATAVFTQNSINSEYPVLRQSITQSLKVQLDQYTRYKLPTPQFFEIGKVFSRKDGQYVEHYSLGVYHHDSGQLLLDLKQLNLEAAVSQNFAEIILDNIPTPSVYTPLLTDGTAIELTSQIITLDANVTLSTPQDPFDLIRQYTAKIDPQILWSIQIVDTYQSRYTFRVSYYNCDDKTAKSAHLKAFNLN